MRPYFVLSAVLVLAVSAFSQQPYPAPNGPASWVFGPQIPYLTTPMVSFQTISPNPVGASNATTGLIAGATNSTLSQIQGSTSSEYTVGVWYQGGAPLVTPQVDILPERLAESEARGLHAMRHLMGEEGPRPPEGPRQREEHKSWIYFTAKDHTASLADASAGRGSRQSGHVYGNDDVTRQNDANGIAKWDGKSEKIQ